MSLVNEDIPEAEEPTQNEEAEVVPEPEIEVDASPTARPQSRGSISPSRKTISRTGSARSGVLSRPHTSLSTNKLDVIEDASNGDELNDDGYDTDLEIEDSREEYDTTGKTTYKDACRQFGVIPVSYFLRHMQDTELIMRHHGLGPAGTKAIAVSLVSNTKILKLDLSDNWLSAQGGNAIANMLKENCYISELVLSDNKLATNGAIALCETLQENTTITHVTLAGNDFDDNTAPCLAEMITNTQRIEQLDLSHNSFASKAGEVLGLAVAENTSIKLLDLSWNHFRGPGAIALARGLGANIFLKKVDISWNGMGLEGAKAIGEALVTNNVLEDLNVSNNRISAEGAVMLAKGLLSNETLRVLRIGKNPMQSAGAFGVLTAVRQNSGSAIELLDFSNIVVNKDFLELQNDVTEERTTKLQILTGGAETEKKVAKRVDPMVKLRNYIVENDLRLVDFFNEFDQDHDMTVTREEFQQGIEGAGIQLTLEEMKALMDLLDKDGDGVVDYSELVIGNLEHMQKEKQKAREAAQEAAEAGV